MTGQEIQLTKHFAQNQIALLTTLVSALETAEHLIEQNKQYEQMANQYSYDVNMANSRINEDAATIAIKDGQLKNAATQIEELQSQINNMRQPAPFHDFPSADESSEDVSIPSVNSSYDIGTDPEAD